MKNNTFEKNIISLMAEGMAQESLERGLTPSEQYFLPKDISEVLMDADEDVSEAEIKTIKNYVRGAMEAKMIEYTSKIFSKIQTNEKQENTTDSIPDIVA